MAVNWNLKYTIGAGTTSLNFATKAGVDNAACTAERIGGTNVTITPLGCPAVPTEAECEAIRERLVDEYFEPPEC